jgi:hypothetical protein
MVLALTEVEAIAEDAGSALLIKARAILDFHRAGRDVFCDGCLQQWARLAPVPCEPARWAGLVVETDGLTARAILGKQHPG